MLVCRACLRRYFCSVTRNGPSSYPATFGRWPAPSSAPRWFSTTSGKALFTQTARPNDVSAEVATARFVATGDGSDRKGQENRGFRQSAWGRSRPAKKQWKTMNRLKGDAGPRLLGKDRRTSSLNKQGSWVERRRQKDDRLDGTGEEHPRGLALMEKIAKKDLVYLPDPLKLADHVKGLLAKGQDDRALALVRLAGRTMSCTVSWNHLLNHHLTKHGPKVSWRLFNEMKKRAQIPDSHTYLVMLNGLADFAHFPGTITRALTIYHSMDAPNSRVQPSVMHTNALLKVAARSNRMDTIWTIAGKMDGKGPQAADKLTYTTILNAMRFYVADMLERSRARAEVEKDAKDADPTSKNVYQVAPQVSSHLADQIIEGRRLWALIVDKWRGGHIFMDQQLVCAMGRLLLVGSRPRDWDDVFSLIEQTMNIPRMTPRLGSPSAPRPGGARPSQMIGQADGVQDGLQDTSNLALADETWRSPSEKDVSEGEQFAGEFDAVVPNGSESSAGGSSLSYVKPDSNTLSLLQEAAIWLRSKQASTGYWDLLTDPNSYGLKPDMDNVHARLRVLRLLRSSGDALDLMKTAAAPVAADESGYGLKLEGKTFRIGLAACTRNQNNANSLVHAGDMTDLMLRVLPEVDIKAAYVLSFMLYKKSLGQALLAVLPKLEAVAQQVRNSLAYGQYTGGGPRVKLLSADNKQFALMTLQKLVSIYHRLLDSEILTTQQRRRIDQERRRLDDFIFRRRNRDWAHGREEPEADETSEAGKGKFKFLKLKQMAVDQKLARQRRGPEMETPLTTARSPPGRSA